MSEETKAPEKTKKPRLRSPAHPILDLGTALQRAREFYDHETGHWASPDTALGHWGFKARNSKGLRYVAALKQFGLLEEKGSKTGREVRMSPAAKVLLLNPDQESHHWRQTVRESALSPKIYDDLWKEWGGDSELPSDKTMAYDLQMKWAFNRRAIDSFIRDFRTTLEFAGLLERHILGDELEQDPNKAENDGEADESPQTARVPMEVTTEGIGVKQKAEVHDFTIPLRGAGVAVLSVPVPLSDHNFTQIEEWLKWAQDSLVYHSEDDE